MEYKINMSAAFIELEAIEQAIGEIDPAAVAGLDASGTVLRVSTTLGDDALLSVLGKAGHRISLEQLERVPSGCCGGCGG